MPQDDAGLTVIGGVGRAAEIAVAVDNAVHRRLLDEGFGCRVIEKGPIARAQMDVGGAGGYGIAQPLHIEHHEVAAVTLALDQRHRLVGVLHARGAVRDARVLIRERHLAGGVEIGEAAVHHRVCGGGSVIEPAAGAADCHGGGAGKRCAAGEDGNLDRAAVRVGGLQRARQQGRAAHRHSAVHHQAAYVDVEIGPQRRARQTVAVSAVRVAAGDGGERRRCVHRRHAGERVEELRDFVGVPRERVGIAGVVCAGQEVGDRGADAVALAGVRVDVDGEDERVGDRLVAADVDFGNSPHAEDVDGEVDVAEHGRAAARHDAQQR